MLYGVLLLTACGGSSPRGAAGAAGAAGGAGGSGGVAPRQWGRQLVQANAGLTGVAIAGDGTVDVVYAGSVGGEHGIVWQQIGGATELVSVAGTVDSRPAVGRDASGRVHVVWGTTMPNEVRYAVRDAAAGWTVETISTERFKPDLAVSTDGTPHVAFVDTATTNAMAYHAVRGASGWQITAVHATNRITESQVGIALDANGVPIIAAPDADEIGVWVAQANGTAGWTVEDLAGDRPVSGPLALAAAAAGVAVAFKDQTSTVVAWRPAGAAAWSIENASHHDSSIGPLDVVVTPSGPMVVSDVDIQYPNGQALLERIGTGWIGQLICGGVCYDSALAVAVNPAGQPAIALLCNRALYYMTVVGHYPADWPQRCAAAAKELCSRACTCASNGSECSWGLNGSSTDSSSLGCPMNAQDSVCGDPTISPTALQQCRDHLPSLTCDASGPLDLSGACGPLYDPFASP